MTNFRLDPSLFGPEADGGGAATGDFYTKLGELEIMVRGTDGSPDTAAINLAQIVLEYLEPLRQQAIALLTAGMRGAGWYLESIDAAAEARRQRCDFLLGFTAESGGLDNAWFSVGFSYQPQNPASPFWAIKVVLDLT